MRAKRGAGGEVALAGAAEEAQRSASIAEPAERRKQPDFGACIHCGQHIRLTSGATTCPTCSAWRRWFSAHRIASRALREVPR